MEDETPSSSNVTFNPFEAESLDSLHLPTFSPSVFSTKVRTTSNAKKKPPEFRWSIDQLASLYPADIDENVEQVEVPLDHEMEAKVQSTISRFFEENLHVPSPWSNPSQAAKKKFNSSGLSLSQKLYSCEPSSGKDNSPQDPPSRGVDAVCQTAITLPVNFDLIALLDDKCKLYSEPEEDPNILSTSLRRKLFSHSDNSHFLSTPGVGGSLLRTGTPASNQGLPSPHLSPVEKDEDCHGETSKPKTPNSGGSQFSSSPLVRLHAPRVCTPFTPRGPSPHTKNLGTPLLSPICKDSETPRTGKLDKRNHISRPFASKLSFSSDVSSSSPSPLQIKSWQPSCQKSSPVSVPVMDEDNSNVSMEVSALAAESETREPAAAANGVRGRSELDDKRPCSRLDFTSCLFPEGDRIYENDKLTSTQLVEGNSGHDLTFDLTMNDDGNLTAMEISSVHYTGNSIRTEHKPVPNGDRPGDLIGHERRGLEQEGPMVQMGEMAQSVLVKNNIQGRLDSGYATHSLPTSTVGTLATVSTSSSSDSTESLPALTLSSTGSPTSLSL